MEAGTATVMRASSRGKSKASATPSHALQHLDVNELADRKARSQLSAGYRARRTLRDYAVANRLDTFITLTYTDEPSPERSHQDLYNFKRRLLGRKGGDPWAAVSQYGKENQRLHHHVLVPGHPDLIEVDKRWDMGYVDVQYLETAEDIRRTAHYLAGDFNKPSHERPCGTRYHISRGTHHPTRETLTMTESELTRYLHALKIHDISWRTPSDPDAFVVKQGFWEPF